MPPYIPSYGSSLFASKLRRMTGRSPKVLSTGKEHQIGHEPFQTYGGVKSIL